MVDLKCKIKVSGLTVTGRSDGCCPERTQGYDVYVGDYSSAAEITANAPCVLDQPALAGGGQPTEITCNEPVTGQYVWFYLPGAEKILTLCEVQVHGVKAGCPAGHTGPECGTCAPCAEGTYKDEEGNAECTACPADSSALAGSVSIEACSCNPGFNGPDGGECVACAENTYKDQAGDADCIACPEYSVSSAGSSSVSSCRCDMGFSGPDGGQCEECWANQYKNTTGSVSCTACPANSESLPGSVDVSACICSAGYTGPNGGPCVACEPKRYKDSAGDGTCSDCPEFAESPSASTDILQCKCSRGYTGLDGGTCTPCGENFFKDTVGSNACIECPGYSSSPEASGYRINCTCDDGYYGDDCGYRKSVGAGGDAYDSIPFGTEINFGNKFVKGFHSANTDNGQNNPGGVFAWTVKSGGAVGEGGNILGNPYEPPSVAQGAGSGTGAGSSASSLHSSSQTTLSLSKIKHADGATMAKFCHSPCKPELVPQKGEVALHASFGGACWDLGFKDMVESAVECQQQCAGIKGCQMWDYRAKRADKRCHFCSSTDADAGEFASVPCARRGQSVSLPPCDVAP